LIHRGRPESDSLAARSHATASIVAALGIGSRRSWRFAMDDGHGDAGEQERPL